MREIESEREDEKTHNVYKQNRYMSTCMTMCVLVMDMVLEEEETHSLPYIYIYLYTFIFFSVKFR